MKRFSERTYILEEPMEESDIHYVFVTRRADRRLEAAFCTPFEAGEEAVVVGSTLANAWTEAATKFPYPEFDLVTATGRSYQDVQDAFPEVVGFEAVTPQLVHWVRP